MILKASPFPAVVHSDCCIHLFTAPASYLLSLRCSQQDECIIEISTELSLQFTLLFISRNGVIM
jgi:hypothetical protein